MTYDLSLVRNLGIIAHIDAGKTTFTERALFYAGRIHKIGEVDEGSAAMDWMDQEKERGITITSAVATLEWQECQVNLIDTPGHVDFTAEVERSLRILDGAIVIFCAVEGVEPQSEAVWHRADRYGLPRIVFVNKMDRIGADFFSVLEMMSKRLDAKAIPVQIPIGAEAEFVGVIDLLSMEMLRWNPEDKGKTYSRVAVPKAKRKLAQRYRDRLVEAIACTDETLLERVANGAEEVSSAHLKAALRAAVLRSDLVPVFCGSALRNAGIQPVLDAAVDYFPSPIDRPPVVRENLLTREKVDVRPNPEDPCALLVFKVMHLQDKVKVWFCRIYSGTVQEGDILYNSTRKIAERVSHVMRMHGPKKEMLRAAGAGEIVGLVGLKNTYTGDTLCSSVRPVVLEAMDFPEPVVAMAIEPKAQGDLKKMLSTLSQLESEDPTFRVKQNKETGQTVISGMGELHLEVLIERLKREFKVEARTGQPQVAFKEGIRRQGTGTGTFSKTSGAVAHTVTVTIAVKPAPRGHGLVLESEADLDPRSTDRYGSLKRALENTMSAGVLMGYPMIDICATIVSVDEENLDRRDQAYYNAATAAFRNALQNAHPVLLEPIMKGEIMTPREYSSRVIEGLSIRGGKINEIVTRGPLQIIAMSIPAVANIRLRDAASLGEPRPSKLHDGRLTLRGSQIKLKVGNPQSPIRNPQSIALLFLALLGVFVWKFTFEFGRRADAMVLVGGPFGQFEIVASFPGVPEETAGEVREGDEMIIRGWQLASVIERSFQPKQAANGELHLRFRSPNWLKYYLDPSPGTEVAFVTDAYSLKGHIESTRL